MAHTEEGDPAPPDLEQPGFGLTFMSKVGLFSIDGASFTPWNVSGQSTLAADGGATVNVSWRVSR